MDRDDEIITEMIDVKLELNWEMENEEMYWEQRARTNWLQQGDKNTAFFHSQASKRRGINKIQEMEDKMLTESYKEEEIKEALNSIGVTKAPGPDGFPAIFFQKYWHIVRCEPTDSKKYWNSASTKRKVLLSQEVKGYLHYLDLLKRNEIYEELRQVGEAHRSLTSSSRMIGGKVVFIKAVLQAIPTYTMGCFLLRKSVCEDIYSQILVAKGPRKEGNTFVYMEQSLRIEGVRWSGISLVWRVGNGHNIRIEADVWVPNASSLHINHRVRGQNLVMVANLIGSNTSSWKAELIKSTFSEEDATKILQISLASTTHEDFLAWRGEHTGEYTLLVPDVRKDWRIENTPFETIVLASDAVDCQKLLCAIWDIWTARNKWVHEKKKQSGKEVAKFTLQYLQELKDIKQAQVIPTTSNSIWRPLEKGYHKINFDAAVDHKTNKSCSRIIIRDYKGNEIAIRSTIHENIPSGFEAEAIACLQAVILGRYLGLKFVDIEGDSLIVIKKAKSVKKDKSVLGSYIRDIKEISKFFYKSNFQHISRSANESVIPRNFYSKILSVI
ncbi:hypothetical protein CXB51_021840 [Gossypium anomalum]|uniref:RNase H type-1 domain-containing protein n=1 Tax=Gossypium anomalum TaxID=47600 RepID=A0A8J6CU95_9ROSI|nr:hypothetical protein CXB51_021840 [Gossypium anomalum]